MSSAGQPRFTARPASASQSWSAGDLVDLGSKAFHGFSARRPRNSGAKVHFCRAVSSGCCKEEVAEGFGGGGVAEDAAGPGVEPGGDVVEVVLAVAGQVGDLGEVVAEQAVCVLVGAALPG